MLQNTATSFSTCKREKRRSEICEGGNPNCKDQTTVGSACISWITDDEKNHGVMTGTSALEEGFISRGIS